MLRLVHGADRPSTDDYQSDEDTCLGCSFSSWVSRPFHCEAHSFPGKLEEIASSMKASKASEAVLLFDAIEQAVEVRFSV